MTSAAGHGVRAAARAGARPRVAVGVCLLASVVAWLAGCGGRTGGPAPVESRAGPAVLESDRTYVVGRGDTVYAIAWRHGLDYRVVARANSIRDPYTIYPGQRLVIPEGGEAAPPASDADATASEPAAASAGVSRRGAEARPAPVRKPLPALAVAPPPQPLPESPPKPPPKPLPDPPPKPRTASASSATPGLAAKTRDGVRWTWPTKGETIKGFGRGGSKGIDIAGTLEQPVRAAAAGEVVYAGDGLVGYGNLVIVKHNRRLLSAYAHNERLHLKEGDKVKGGQHIADMGRSGQGRVMLHFEIRRDGKPVDPLAFLP